MNKNNFPIYFAIAMIIGLLIGFSFSGVSSKPLSFKKKNSQEQKIKRLINFIERDYVDKVDTDELLDGAIAQILGKLDPHSVYIPKENLQAVTENMQGNFVGIGVQFRMIRDSITIIQPIKGGPSIKAGNWISPKNFWSVNFMTGDTYGRFFPQQKLLVMIVRDRWITIDEHLYLGDWPANKPKSTNVTAQTLALARELISMPVHEAFRVIPKNN